MTFAQFDVRSWVRSLWTGAFSGVVLGLLGGAALVLAIGEAPPVAIREAREVDGVAFRGGRIDLLFTIDRTRECPVTTSRYLWRWSEVDGVQVRQFVPLGTSSNASTPISETNRVVISLPIPSDLPEGDWFYWSRSVESCYSILSMFHPFIYQTPDIPVRIVGPPHDTKEFRP